MFEKRLNVESQMRKPTVVLDNRFAFVPSLQLKDTGNIIATVFVENTSLQMDDDGTEFKHLTLKIEKAEILMQKDVRV